MITFIGLKLKKADEKHKFTKLLPFFVSLLPPHGGLNVMRIAHQRFFFYIFLYLNWPKILSYKVVQETKRFCLFIICIISSQFLKKSKLRASFWKLYFERKRIYLALRQVNIYNVKIKISNFAPTILLYMLVEKWDILI